MTRPGRASIAVPALAVALVLGCGASEPRGLGVFAGHGDADGSLEAACQLTERRCSRCHSLDVVLAARVDTPDDWKTYVRRMRRRPGSGILAEDEPILVRCLVHHSFGSKAAP